ncbi:DUF2975 domain-containing protein [Aurantiacibacter rhizosphaerae]|uniref:Uncharacterized protein n=1 Tax=Aurantiacibacter rhizosphaerae TaxID=2691582 RepID=A0A844X957_9SPHN|nr:DUF2975 domain-containing protein [Aurantiacibacter rhizosphaerae]MWV26353.1 hypothetical protein [Aurantiacibacter rhizosphaerae]
MASPSPLDDPENAAFAWARYRRLMRLMMGITLATVVIAMAILYKQVEEVSAHFFIATALGIGFSMLLMSALMGLVFLSSGTGHDNSVEHNLDDLDPDAKPKDRRKLGWKEGAER